MIIYCLCYTDNIVLTKKYRDRYILENYKGYNLSEVAAYVGLTRTSTCRRAKQLGVVMSGHKKENPSGYYDRNGLWHKNGWKRKTPEELSEIRSKTMKRVWSEHEHPKGYLGHKRTEEWKKMQSERLKKAWADKGSSYNSAETRQKKSDVAAKSYQKRIHGSAGNIYSRSKRGWVDFESGKHFFLRSSWEEKYGKYIDQKLINKEILDWEYEPDTFWFEKIKRGVRSYTPDFKVFCLDGTIEYHETKGWLDKKSQTKLKRMRIYYPKIIVKLIMQKEMKDLGLL